jgi:DNA-binding NtrC family response regulator
VVLVTAYASYSEVMRALRLRALDVVSKPFEAHRLIETVRRAALRRETGLRPYEALDGLTNRVIESIQLASASAEHLRLSQSRKLKLDDLRTTAKNVLNFLSAL